MDKPNPSLEKKSAARLSAVQYLYSLAITGETLNPQQYITALKAQLAHNESEQKLLVGVKQEPDYKLAEAILEGIGQWRADIDARLDSALSAHWKRERMSPLLLAILQCAIFELFFHKDAKPGIIIDEYTRLSRRFFADDEMNFVHGALQALAQRYGKHE